MTGRPRPPTWSRPWPRTRTSTDKVDLQVQVAGPERAAADPADQRDGPAGCARRSSSTRSRRRPEPGGQERLRQGRDDHRLRRRDHRALRLQRLRSTRRRPGRVTAEWLVDKLGGKGNIVVITGVPGTSVDTLRTKAAKEVFAKHPEHQDRRRGRRHVEPGGRPHRALQDPRHPLLGPDRRPVDAGGCFTANSMQLEAGKTPEQAEALRRRRLERRPHPDAAGRHRGRGRRAAPTRRWARRASPTPRRPIPAVWR